MQENVQEQAVALAYSSLNNTNDSTPIALFGCVGTYSNVGFANDTYTITKGAILYNGEIYQVPAMVATRANLSETIVFRVDTNTYQSGEPTPYTDGTPRNTNQNRTIKIYNGLTGTGIVDALNMKFLNRAIRITSNSANPFFDSFTIGNGTLDYVDILVIKKGNLIILNYNIGATAVGTAGIGLFFTLNFNFANDNITSFTTCEYPFNCTSASGVPFGNGACKFLNNNDLRIYNNTNTSGVQYNFKGNISYTTNTIG